MDSTATPTYVARQSIVDRAGRVAGHELLFRSRRRAGDAVYATASVAAKAFADPTFAEVLGPHRGFINVDVEFLLSDVVEFLPPDRTVLEILEDTVYTPAVVERCRVLKSRGYLLATDDYAGDRATIAPALHLLDIIKLDLPKLNPSDLARQAKELAGKILLAEKVETPAEHAACMAAGCALFQGFYFARPESVGAAGADPGRMAALGLLAMLARDESDAVLESGIKRHPALAAGMLRLVNSAAAGLARPISSFRQALAVVGRRQIARWLQLLVYVGAAGSRPEDSPLLQLAAVRARTMELLAIQLGRAGERAFLVGLVSLFDAATGLSRDEIAGRLSLDEEIRAALAGDAGPLGALLALAEAMGRGSEEAMRRAMADLPALEGVDLYGISTAALRWVGALGAGSTD